MPKIILQMYITNYEAFGEGKDPSKLLKSGGLSDKNTAFHHTQTHTHTHTHSRSSGWTRNYVECINLFVKRPMSLV